MPSGAAVLLYHHVGERERDPWGLCVGEDRLREHVEAIAGGYRPVRLSELASGRVPDRAVAVTFDDGYASTLHRAKPLLEAAEVPATVFVVTGYTGSEREFWWDAVSRLVPEEGFEEEWERIRGLASPEIEALLAELRGREDSSWERSPSGDDRPMTADELGELVDGGLVEVGAHTRLHPVLGARDAAIQRAEIEGSVRDLEGWLDRPVEHFAYPFGHRDRDYGPETVGLTRELGLALAATAEPGLVTPGTALHELPRHYVPDVPGDELERWLAGLFEG